MAKTSPTVLTDQWPILVLLPSSNLEEAKHALAVVDEIYQTHQEPYVTVLDARNGKRPTAVERTLQNEFRVKHEDYVRKYCRGSALVCNSEIIRGVATAMFWFKKPDTSTKAFTDMDEAVAWALSLLEP
jgi:hypothetical protein